MRRAGVKLSLAGGSIAICRLDAGASIPRWASRGAFTSITRTPRELSVVCDESTVPARVKAERGWRALVVDGPLDFNLTGVIAGLAGVLAKAAVSVFVVSTYDTDYVLVRDHAVARAVVALRAAGYRVSTTRGVR